LPHDRRGRSPMRSRASSPPRARQAAAPAHGGGADIGQARRRAAVRGIRRQAEEQTISRVRELGTASSLASHCESPKNPPDRRSIDFLSTPLRVPLRGRRYRQRGGVNAVVTRLGTTLPREHCATCSRTNSRSIMRGTFRRLLLLVCGPAAVAVCVIVGRVVSCGSRWLARCLSLWIVRHPRLPARG
jgi:hypothetical protein